MVSQKRLEIAYDKDNYRGIRIVWSFGATIPQSYDSQAPLFQVLVNRLGHLKHVQFLTAKDRLQLVVGQYFSFVLWILKFVLLNVRPNLFCDFASRQWFGANNFGEVL